MNNNNAEDNRSLKYEKENIELRRSKVLELDARSYSQHEIARILNVSVGLINSDIQHIRAQAKESIKEYINEKLPEEYNRCLIGLSSILKESWTLSLKTDDTREKIQALSLAKQCYDAKLDLLTNVDVVQDVIKFIDKSKESAKSFRETSSQTEEEQSSDSNSSSEDLDGTTEDPSPIAEAEPVQEEASEEE